MCRAFRRPYSIVARIKLRGMQEHRSPRLERVYYSFLNIIIVCWYFKIFGRGLLPRPPLGARVNKLEQQYFLPIHIYQSSYAGHLKTTPFRVTRSKLKTCSLGLSLQRPTKRLGKSGSPSSR